MYNFFTSIEFYVIACVVAAAIVIFSAMPKQVGEARQFLLGGFLCSDTDDADDAEQTQHGAPAQNNSNQIQNNVPGLQNNNYNPVTFTDSPAIVEVRTDGYRAVPETRGTRQGKKQSQTTLNQPHWLTGTAEGKEPEIDLLCMDDGTVKLIRKGLNGLVTADGAVSLACTLIGFDLKIEERIVYGGRDQKTPPPTEAVFSLEFLASNEHYHIHYNSDTIHRMAAFTLPTKGGIHIVRPLT